MRAKGRFATTTELVGWVKLLSVMGKQKKYICEFCNVSEFVVSKIIDMR